MKILLLLTAVIFSPFFCSAQDNLQTKEKNIRSTNFTDVQCLLLNNYSPKLSSGVYFYPKYSIQRRKYDYLIKATSKSRNIYSWTVPLSGIEKRKKMDTIKNPLKLKFSSRFKDDRYISDIQTYKVGDSTYLIYKHINYNCYDPSCGTKHNHITSVDGETYFSPDYGILVTVDNQNMQYNLMAKIKGKKIPYDLIIQILKSRKTDNKIVQEYIRKTR
jgi:hypothetical protein